jgi:arabinan endo-1,5-alpha-L-arabinosidase
MAIRHLVAALLIPAAVFGQGTTVLGVRSAVQGRFQGKFPNPLTPFGAADPGVLRADGVYYVYSTSGGGTGALPIRWSSDRIRWVDDGTRVFPKDRPELWPKWRKPGTPYWAPEVHRIAGRYVCYYAAQGTDGWFKIGAATSDTPRGPFRDIGAPVVSNEDYSLIDPTFFRDTDGRQYLLWKDNTNALDPPRKTHIVIAGCSADGLRKAGASRRILWTTLDWEGPLIEAPTLIKRGRYYYLFYSGNTFTNERYAIGVARATDIHGPYEKKGAPIVRSDRVFDGPGGQFVLTDPDGTWRLYYHARLRSDRYDERFLMMDRIRWGKDDWPHVHDGTPSR